MSGQKRPQVSPEEYGRALAEQAPPLTREQSRAAARIFASVRADEAAARGDAA